MKKKPRTPRIEGYLSSPGLEGPSDAFFWWWCFPLAHVSSYMIERGELACKGSLPVQSVSPVYSLMFSFDIFKFLGGFSFPSFLSFFLLLLEEIEIDRWMDGWMDRYVDMQVFMSLYFPLDLNLGSPMPWPRSLTLRTRSMALRTFWSGTAVPRSNSATTPAVVLHRVARSFCVIFGSIFCRAALMASPTTLPTVFGLMMSSLRSTFVRCWPSGPLPT